MKLSCRSDTGFPLLSRGATGISFGEILFFSGKTVEVTCELLMAAVTIRCESRGLERLPTGEATAMITTTSYTLLEDIRGDRNESAWREFYRRYAPMLVSFGKRLGLSDADADEAMQETMIDMIQVDAEFQRRDRPSSGTGRRRFKTWLCSVAKHKIRDVQRGSQRRDRLEEHLAAASSDDGEGTDIDEAFEPEWQRMILSQALQRLATEVEPAVYQAFILYAAHGQPAQEVADLLGISRNAVFLSKHRLVRRIRALVLEICESEG